MHRLLFSLCLLAAACVLSAEAPPPFPTPFSPNNRVLGLICHYNMDHIDSLYLILTEYVSMCEGGWEPKIVLFTTADYTPPARRIMQYRTYCYRTNTSLALEYSVHDPSISINLAAQHRRYMNGQVKNFDVFIYHEDDMIFKFHQLSAFLFEIRKLQRLIPDTALRDNTFGFLRYRRLNANHGYLAKDVVEQELLDEEPAFHHICIGPEPYIQVSGNMHQAMWVFTQEHVTVLQDKCNFLNHSSASREFMSSFSIYDKKPHHCGLNKLMSPNFHSFFIQHYYQSRMPHWFPVFKTTDNLLAGRNYNSDHGDNSAALPECWRDLALRHQQIQFAPMPTPAPTVSLAPTPAPT